VRLLLYIGMGAVNGCCMAVADLDGVIWIARM